MEEKGPTRRKFIRFLLEGAVVSLAFKFTVESSPNKPKNKKNNQENLEVKKFSKKILDAVIARDKNKIKYDSISPYTMGYGMALFGQVLNPLKLEHKGRTLAAATASLCNIVDALSTLPAVEKIQDQRFREYGFDEFFYEGNALVKPHPTVEDITRNTCFTAPLLGGLTYVYPPAVGFYIPSLLPLAGNNLRNKDIMTKGYVLGDKVKEMIEQGKSEEDINRFLDSYANKRGLPTDTRD